MTTSDHIMRKLQSSCLKKITSNVMTTFKFQISFKYYFRKRNKLHFFLIKMKFIIKPIFYKYLFDENHENVSLHLIFKKNNLYIYAKTKYIIADRLFS